MCLLFTHYCAVLLGKASFPFHSFDLICSVPSSTLPREVLHVHLFPPSYIFRAFTYNCRTSPNLIRRYGANGGGAAAAEHFAGKAMARILEALDAPQLPDIQALCLLVIHEWGSKNAVRAYAYLGLATRMLQMHRIIHGNLQPDDNRFLKEESFRRTLWLIFVLDCFLTSTPGRYPALTTSDYAGVALPCNDINFAFGNSTFVETLLHRPPSGMPDGAQLGEVGEFGHIVLATSTWREVVQMLVTSSIETFNESSCADLINIIDTLRSNLPLQYVEKTGQIQLHITMGSGLTYAFLHCLLHCATIFVYRRRLLQSIASPNVNVDLWRTSPHCHEIVDRLMSSCHSAMSLLTALNAGSDKESLVSYPIFMLFAAFTSSSTTAYISMKGLTPPNSVETAASIVREGLHFMQGSLEVWPLIGMWYHHLSVMQRVLNNDGNAVTAPGSAHMGGSPSVKDEAGSNQGAGDEMDTTGGGNQNDSVSGSIRGESEPPVPARKSGFSAINGGGSAGVSTPATGTPPPAEGTPAPGSASGPKPEASQPAPQNDMTAVELCEAFERQLLGQDDLAAFMGGGV